MATLKDHQATMVSMLASGTAIPTSAIRLAHALHDVLAYLNNTNVAPEAHTERRINATTPGLNDVMLAEAIKSCSGKIMSDVQKQSEDFAARWKEKQMRQLVNESRMIKSAEQSLESLLKQRDNTIRQLKGRVADLKSDYANLEAQLNAVLAIHKEPEQAGCRKDDTQLPDESELCPHPWTRDYFVHGGEVIEERCGCCDSVVHARSAYGDAKRPASC